MCLFLGMPACVCHSDTRFHFGSHTLRNRGLAYSWTLPKGQDNSWDQWRHRVPWMNTSFRIYACLDFEWNMDTFSLDDNPQILLELRVCTLVNVFLLPVVPQPKLCCVITHLRGWYGDGWTTFFRHLPWRMVVITAAFIPEANRFHPNILASLCHLALLQVLSVCYWHLVLGLYWQSKKGASHITKA